ncbi:MAG: bifunctional biotin--[acetyl-CoA-carboxylase] ligase/biotin operon repressor BirA, partial [Pseudomonadota bacterium]
YALRAIGESGSSMSTSSVLPLLADGEFHSGQALAEILGVSRTAVWKQLKKVTEASGLEMESVRGRGYRIPGGLDLLQRSTVEAELDAPARSLIVELELLERTDSTNAHALRRAAQTSLTGLVCTAEQQTAGRGRQGRRWISPYAKNLYVSVLWEFAQGAASLEGLSLAVGVAVVEALRRCGVAEVQLKWPNDVVADGKKLGGVLLEIAGDAAGPCQVVIGIGINVAMPATAGRAIDQQWTDVRSLAADSAPTRSVLLGSLLNEMMPMVADFERQGFEVWRERWQSLDACADQKVTLTAGDRRVSGIARGVDGRGALQLETQSGVQSLYGGELSLRLQS